MARKPARRAKKTAKRHSVARPKGILWNVHINPPRSRPEGEEGETVTRQLYVPGTSGMADVRTVYSEAERAFHVPEERMLAVPARDGKGKIITRRPRS